MENNQDSDEGCSYRCLIRRMSEDEEGQLFARVLLPWLAASPGKVAWLAALRERGSVTLPVLEIEDLWELYALSRLCELLVFETEESALRAPRLSMPELEDFLARLGIDVLRPMHYSAFHHEIVRLVPAQDPAHLPSLLGYEWPCLMLGSLLLMRGGVSVQAGREVLAPGIADAATLYWAYSRPRRPAHDLAHGWGSNSAWRTAFRRDYALDGQWHFNVDGTVDLELLAPDAVDEYGLTVAQRVELLVNRSFITTNREHADLFPYADRFSAASLQADDEARLPFWKRLFA